MDLSTAYERWDDAWRDPAQRGSWLAPDPAVAAVVERLAVGTSALDVGCGVGRHAALMASRGIDVVALDASAAGLAQARGCAAAVGFLRAPFSALPFASASFDYVLAWNVVYHGDGAVVTSALRDVARVLRPGGTYQATMLSKRNRKFGVGVEVRPDTFVVDGDTGDKAHPHFYCDEAGLRALHAPWFDVVSLDEVDQATDAWHWQLIATRR